MGIQVYFKFSYLKGVPNKVQNRNCVIKTVNIKNIFIKVVTHSLSYIIITNKFNKQMHAAMYSGIQSCRHAKPRKILSGFLRQKTLLSTLRCSTRTSSSFTMRRG